MWTQIVWWPGVVLNELTVGQTKDWLAVAGAAAATYYVFGLPSLDAGIVQGVAYPYLGMGVALYAANMIAKVDVTSASVSY